MTGENITAPLGASLNGHTSNATAAEARISKKLHGRAFYESIGSPKYIVAPMVDQSEFAWRMLTRSFLPESQRSSILAYTPMFHARLFSDTQKFREAHFEPTRPSPWSAAAQEEPAPKLDLYLDGNPKIDRPLFVQFCANDPDTLLSAARLAAPYCDAVDINLGCPQGIARKGHYGAFLQEDQDLIFRLINILHENLDVPVTAKIRILETKEATLAYAQNVVRAGASILTVHGRRREQKGHLTGLADWKMIRYLRDNLPPETVIFANGNILQQADLQRCLDATGADGVMSAEGNLSDPSLFGPVPAVGQEGREYWRGKDDRGGYRVDAVMRRYLDIIYTYVMVEAPPARRPLFVPGDDAKWLEEQEDTKTEEPQRKKRKKEPVGKDKGGAHANFVAMQAHLFHLLRHFVSKHTDVRDKLARNKKGHMEGYEEIMAMVERKVAQGLLEYERTDGKSVEEDKGAPQQGAGENGDAAVATEDDADADELDYESSVRVVKKCKRPWWVAQPIIRPLPKEAEAKGAITASKKVKPQQQKQQQKPTGQQKQANGGKKKETGEQVEKLEHKTDYPQNELVSG